ncbi:MAG: chromate transporter, partial [Anaerolinea sp.]|nr:chromate transporter [Anaerolinea sp.]
MNLTNEISQHPSISEKQDQRLFVPLITIFWAYFQVGLTGFGLAIIQKVKTLIMTRHWLTEEEMNDGLAMVQLYPGPLIPDFTAYVGYVLRGIPGALAAILGFILPSLVLMLGLSVFYFSAGNLPWVHPLFLGLEALVVGVILNVTLDMGSRAIKGRIEAGIGLFAFAALVFKINAVWMVLAALLLGVLFLRPKAEAGKQIPQSNVLLLPSTPKRRWLGIGISIAVVLAVV